MGALDLISVTRMWYLIPSGSVTGELVKEVGIGEAVEDGMGGCLF